MRNDGQQFYEFEDFRLDAARGVLSQGETIINITPKAVEILRLLVENRGETVSKDEIFAEVWPDSFVEEANLSHHIFRLRKALGESEDRKLIETVPKRGYRFVGELRISEPVVSVAEPGEPERPRRWWIVPALAALALISLTSGWYFYSRRTQSATHIENARDIRSIAVMPFVNESGSDEIEYLSDGMTETLINSLSEVPSLNVKSRPAVFRFKGREVSPQTIASELNVQAVLFGRLTLRGNDLTLFLSLIDPPTENQIWGKQYVRKLSDLVALQNEIGRDVAQSLEARLTAAGEDSLSKNYSKKGDAYRSYLLGDYYWAKFTKENFLRAKKHYEDAIAIDPEYALAYAGLANTYTVLGVNGHIPSAEAGPKSRAAAERSIELAPNLAEAHVALGAYKMFFDWDLDGADGHFSKAMELDRDYAVPHELRAYVLRARGRHEEAIAEAKRANEIDPLNLLMIGDIGVCYRFAGQGEQAIETNKRLLEMDPNFADARFENGLLLAQLGSYEAALVEEKEALSLSANSTKIKSGLGIVYGRAGDLSNAKKVIDELIAGSGERYVSPMDIALIYSTMNDKDKAFEWLEKAYLARTPWMFELNVTPELAPLRDDPRFADLLRRVGLATS
ncbi:MAG TPA: winged helix-turn-helix domain-containing protein [Pyrinomonadaceae bacterium]|nr:winged helix-turn-helix domain-containing protein [Pyrinomonadaceae bacterium]